ncbi:MAG: hypothetical protein ABR973_08030 [Candidatus Acidiferrales bacterium]|jgi:metal-responsive CopG/Arc/MetJ family transcriptional regulator
MAKGTARHIYLNEEQAFLLDAIGAAMGKRRLGVEPSRSQLILSAIRNFIEDCRDEEDLREAIDEAKAQLVARNNSPHAS